MGMKELNIERAGYMYLVGEKEKRVLSGLGEMKFCDFRRHEFLTAFFDFHLYNMKLWDQFAGKFETEFQSIIGMVFEEAAPYSDFEYEWQEQDIWIKEFCSNAPEEERDWLRQLALEKSEGNGVKRHAAN